MELRFGREMPVFEEFLVNEIVRIGGDQATIISGPETHTHGYYGRAWREEADMIPVPCYEVRVGGRYGWQEMVPATAIRSFRNA